MGQAENATEELELVRKELNNRKVDCGEDHHKLQQAEKRLNIENRELKLMRQQGQAYVLESRKLVSKLDKMLKQSKEENKHKVDKKAFADEHAQLTKALQDLSVKDKELHSMMEHDSILNATNVKL